MDQLDDVGCWTYVSCDWIFLALSLSMIAGCCIRAKSLKQPREPSKDHQEQSQHGLRVKVFIYFRLKKKKWTRQVQEDKYFVDLVF